MPYILLVVDIIFTEKTNLRYTKRKQRQQRHQKCDPTNKISNKAKLIKALLKVGINYFFNFNLIYTNLVRPVHII